MCLPACSFMGMCHSSIHPPSVRYVTVRDGEFYQTIINVSTATDKHWVRRPGYEANVIDITYSVCTLHSSFCAQGRYLKLQCICTNVCMTRCPFSFEMFCYDLPLEQQGLLGWYVQPSPRCMLLSPSRCPDHSTEKTAGTHPKGTLYIKCV